jgi:hypothetical protein|tara:strand:+ start:960 stop:1892 length:933 start_codon:yes stop_codon:yes gene_type:complete
MAITTGTTVFNLDMNDLIEEAFERCGQELRTGYNFRTARRSLNILTIEWANRGLNFWTVEQNQIPMVTGQAMYPVPVNTIDILDSVIRQNNSTTNQIDINISRIAEPTYMSLPNKLAQGRPIQVWYNRQSGQENTTNVTLIGGISASDVTITVSSVAGLTTSGFIKIGTETISYPNVDPVNNQLLNCARGQNGTTATAHSTLAAISVQNLPCINVWPTPNSPGDQYMFVYYRLRRIQDAGTGVTVQDIPFRFIPCMVAGLAYQLSMKLPDVDPIRISALKMDYEQQWDSAAAEDRDTSPLRFVPRNMFYA